MTDDRYRVEIIVRREDGEQISAVELTGHQPRLLLNGAAVATDAALKAHPATGDLPDEIEVRSAAGQVIKVPADLKDKVHFIDGPIDFNEVAPSTSLPKVTHSDFIRQQLTLDCGCTEAQACRTRAVSTDTTDYGTTYLTAHRTEDGVLHIESEKGHPNDAGTSL